MRFEFTCGEYRDDGGTETHVSASCSLFPWSHVLGSECLSKSNTQENRDVSRVSRLERQIVLHHSTVLTSPVASTISVSVPVSLLDLLGRFGCRVVVVDVDVQKFAVFEALDMQVLNGGFALGSSPCADKNVESGAVWSLRSFLATSKPKPVLPPVIRTISLSLGAIVVQAARSVVWMKMG